MNKLNKFYEKNTNQRILALKEAGIISNETFEKLSNDDLRLNEISDKLIENQISNYELPYGVALNFLVNNKEYVIPMAIEEPSVIAAASYSAKIIKENGGFISKMPQKYICGQIAFTEYENINKIDENKNELIDFIYQNNPAIKNYGKIIDIKYEIKDIFLIVYLIIDSGEAMGANMMNTALESLSNKIKDMINGEILISIISNYGNYSVVESEFKIHTSSLDKNNFKGIDIAKKIVLANRLAKADIYRATTHNKGIMNGITAAVIASGNDFRAIEASIHSFATKSGKYQPLTDYYLENEYLIGKISLPMLIGTVGASITSHPMARLSKEITKCENAKEYSQLIAAVGLAQNFAALRALVSEGIQKGHMKLHYKSMALNSGATIEEIPTILEKIKNLKIIDTDIIKNIIKDLREKGA